MRSLGPRDWPVSQKVGCLHSAVHPLSFAAVSVRTAALHVRSRHNLAFALFRLPSIMSK